MHGSPSPQFISLPLLVSMCLFSSLCLYFCFANEIIYTIFPRFHMYVLIYGICFSLSELVHSVWQSLDPSPTNWFICNWLLNWFLLKIKHIKSSVSSSAAHTGRISNAPHRLVTSGHQGVSLCYLGSLQLPPLTWAPGNQVLSSSHLQGRWDFRICWVSEMGRSMDSMGGRPLGREETTWRVG